MRESTCKKKYIRIFGQDRDNDHTSFVSWKDRERDFQEHLPADSGEENFIELTI
jgi:hypothetical protein